METTINSIVEVFKTNVHDAAEAAILIALLQKHITNSSVNFDLDDCDKVLRIKGLDISQQLVVDILEDQGYKCQLLL
jgi:tRNA G26 N,N-dimethylase Trm1